MGTELERWACAALFLRHARGLGGGCRPSEPRRGRVATLCRPNGGRWLSWGLMARGVMLSVHRARGRQAIMRPPGGYWSAQALACQLMP